MHTRDDGCACVPSFPTQPGRTAVEVNVLVVKRMMEMCRFMRNLVLFIHVSTAYAHTNRCVLSLCLPDSAAVLSRHHLSSLPGSVSFLP
jgi:hypothetical protein